MAGGEVTWNGYAKFVIEHASKAQSAIKIVAKEVAPVPTSAPHASRAPAQLALEYVQAANHLRPDLAALASRCRAHADRNPISPSGQRRPLRPAPMAGPLRTCPMTPPTSQRKASSWQWRLWHAPAPGHPGHQQATAAGVRQAHDLLPAQHPHAGGHPRHPHHQHCKTRRALNNCWATAAMGPEPAIRRASQPRRPGPGLCDR